jgi:hypothetical protein
VLLPEFLRNTNYWVPIDICRVDYPHTANQLT